MSRWYRRQHFAAVCHSPQWAVGSRLMPKVVRCGRRGRRCRRRGGGRGRRCRRCSGSRSRRSRRHSRCCRGRRRQRCWSRSGRRGRGRSCGWRCRRRSGSSSRRSRRTAGAAGGVGGAAGAAVGGAASSGSSSSATGSSGAAAGERRERAVRAVVVEATRATARPAPTVVRVASARAVWPLPLVSSTMAARSPPGLGWQRRWPSRRPERQRRCRRQWLACVSASTARPAGPSEHHFAMQAVYFRPEKFKSKADCLTAAYRQLLPLEVCQ